MIYLYTGSNGSGKTLNAIKFVVEQLNPDGDRPVFYYSPESKPIGIAEAGVLDWTSLTKDQVLDWWDFPEGSIFFIDEFRTVWPYRNHRDPVPKSVDLLSDHRDKGFDFLLTAQKATGQFDPAIQGFIEEHRHLEGVGGSAKSRHFVYQSFCNSPQNPTKYQHCDRETIPFDKKYFSYYRSASIHTHKNRLPYKKLLYLAPLPLILIGLIWFAYSTLTQDRSYIGAESETASALPFVPTSPLNGHSDLSWVDLHTPRIAGLPHTSPAYDDLMKPEQAPKPAACIINHATDICRCHTQQATPLDVPDSLCRSIVASGWFDHSRPLPEPLEGGRYRSGEALAPADTAPRSVVYLHDSPASSPSRNSSEPRLLDPNVTRSNLHNRF
ncbi:zonular occludens toxin domain-containing protein [uncultured Porticoccus sp.]|uniref:zonular occludens toxin domain-containing protein n=1 Tax=uncultured Porticoccus sp. TaxID=1256050 RepID=UPI00260FE0FE|nr:zonular occludens toxin domain-containing protein [uncultured Porticoccus sp.]